MPTVTLEPASIGNRDTWTLEFGSTKPSAVQLPDDDLTSCVAKASASGSQNFYYDAIDALAAYIVSVQFCLRGWKYASAGGGGIDHIWEFSGGSISDCGVNHTPGSWSDICHSNIAHPDSGVWAPADFDGSSTSLMAGVQAANMAAGDGVRVTTLYLSVEYLYAADGFALFVSQWLPPILAVASHGLMKHEIIEILGRIKNRPSNREDFDRLLEAFRRRPRFAF